MSAIPQVQISFDEYLARERASQTKSEYYAGQIFAMSGGTPRHNTISGNIFANARNKLRGTPCRPFNSDQRIRIQSCGLATYPDVSIVCGELRLDTQDIDAIVNPRVIFEVLSNSTESYDRGKKFDFYRQLDTLRNYVLISQEEAQVECFTRQSNGDWLLSIHKGLDTVLPLSTIAIEMLLTDIYEDVVFGPE
jgi:Uma2 family endonuclease